MALGREGVYNQDTEGTQSKSRGCAMADRVKIFLFCYLLLCSACAGGGSEDQATRYLKIIDISQPGSEEHPGADLDAIEIVVNGRTIYPKGVVRVIFSEREEVNRFTDTSNLLGPPDFEEETMSGILCLGGLGGWVIVDVGIDLTRAQSIRIIEHDMEGEESPDTVKVSEGESPDGPWVFLRQGSGDFTITYENP